MKIPLKNCPPIRDSKAFFKAKSLVYVDLFEAPLAVSLKRLKIIKIYDTPGNLYRYFKKGYLMPVDEKTNIQPLIIWILPLQGILDCGKVFDFSAWDPQEDKVVLTEQLLQDFMQRINITERKELYRPSEN